MGKVLLAFVACCVAQGILACIDHADCSKYNKSICYHSWMKTNCKNKCGLCTASTCKDLVTSGQCKHYKGLCGKNTWVNTNCKKTCGTCAGGATTQPPTKSPTACTDHSYCKRYQQSLCSHAWLKMNCKNKCGLCTGATTQTPTQGPTSAPGSCGIPSISQSRVIAGQNSKQGQWPWQIAMLKNGRFSCGGSLIYPQWVVTAAHCVPGARASTIKVVLGDLVRDSKSGTEETIQVEKVISHPSYNRPTRFNNDIALLKLSKPAKLSQHVRTVCLPNQGEEVPVGSKCYISGWGKIAHPGRSTNKLQHASLAILSKTECVSRNKKYGTITDRMVCAANKAGSRQSGCHGDSGGPFVCQQPDGSWKLHGAVSWGSPRCDISDASTVFARVSQLRSWIDQEVNNN